MNDLQIWVLIIGGGIISAVMLFCLIKRGGTVTTKQLSIYIPEANKSPTTTLGISLQYLYESLPLMRQEYESVYLSLAKEAGAKEDVLLANEDVKYFFQMIGNFIYSGNGINSLKTIMEQVLSAKDWPEEKEDLTEYYNTIIKRVCQTVTKYNNQNYDDFVMRLDGTMRPRTVGSVNIFKKLKPLYRTEDRNGKIIYGEIAKLIIDIIDHAIAVEKEGNKK